MDASVLFKNISFSPDVLKVLDSTLKQLNQVLDGEHLQLVKQLEEREKQNRKLRAQLAEENEKILTGRPPELAHQYMQLIGRLIDECRGMIGEGEQRVKKKKQDITHAYNRFYELAKQEMSLPTWGDHFTDKPYYDLEAEIRRLNSDMLCIQKENGAVVEAIARDCEDMKKNIVELFQLCEVLTTCEEDMWSSEVELLTKNCEANHASFLRFRKFNQASNPQAGEKKDGPTSSPASEKK